LRCRQAAPDDDGKTVIRRIFSTHVHPGFQKGLSTSRELQARRPSWMIHRELYFGVSTAMSLGIETGDCHVFKSGQTRRKGAPAAARLLLAGRGSGRRTPVPGNSVYSDFTL